MTLVNVDVNKPIFLSDQAYTNLINEAFIHNYLTSTSQIRPKGIGPYLEQLSKATFIDSRPSYIRQSDYERLTINQLPYWSLELPRRKRYFQLSLEARNNYLNIAILYGISNTNRPHTQRILAISMIAQTIEAIGIGWLTTNDIIPTVPKRKDRRTTRPYYIDSHLFNW